MGTFLRHSVDYRIRVIVVSCMEELTCKLLTDNFRCDEKYEAQVSGCIRAPRMTSAFTGIDGGTSHWLFDASQLQSAATRIWRPPTLWSSCPTQWPRSNLHVIQQTDCYVIASSWQTAKLCTTAAPLVLVVPHLITTELIPVSWQSVHRRH